MKKLSVIYVTVLVQVLHDEEVSVEEVSTEMQNEAGVEIDYQSEDINIVAYKIESVTVE